MNQRMLAATRWADSFSPVALRITSSSSTWALWRTRAATFSTTRPTTLPATRPMTRSIDAAMIFGPDDAMSVRKAVNATMPGS